MVNKRTKLNPQLQAISLLYYTYLPYRELLLIKFYSESSKSYWFFFLPDGFDPCIERFTVLGSVLILLGHDIAETE